MNWDHGPRVGSLSPSFKDLVAKLETSQAVSYVLDARMRLRYCNPAWDTFALQNGGEAWIAGKILGVQLITVIPEVLRPFYLRIFDEVRRTGLVWQHVYECSSSKLYRTYRMRIHHLQSDWLLIVNTLVVETPHSYWTVPDSVYRIDDGPVAMCAHCRCSQRRTEPAVWDFVPAHLEANARSLNISHGICPTCRAYFYPKTS